PSNGFRVDFDGTRTQGAEQSPAFLWTITGGGLTAPIQRSGAKPSVNLPEGAYSVTLTVFSGPAIQSITKTVIVNDILIVSIGDSLSAGEGNPEVRGVFESQGSLLPQVELVPEKWAESHDPTTGAENLTISRE